jgi:hypothetical protein
MAATRDRWKRVPFEAGVPIPFDATYSSREFHKIREGLVPEVMEDKWFIYYEEPHLFLHDSWTGQPVYRVAFEATDDGASVAEALCIAEAVARTSQAYEASLLDFLVGNLLLGEQKPFPVPPRAKNSATGLLQHVIAGTGFPQVLSKEGAARRRWWQFWR